MYNQGFRGNQIVNGIAIIGAETAGSFDETIVHVNVGGTKPGSRDRGLWAINDEWHPEVSDECAFDPACATEQAWRLSKSGTSWSAWSTWTNKSYERYLPLARLAHEAARRARAAATREAGLAAVVESQKAMLESAAASHSDLVRELEAGAERAATLAVSLESCQAELDGLRAFRDRFDAWSTFIMRGTA